MYWLVLHSSNSVVDQVGDGEALHHLVIVSITTLNSVIAFVEVMILSSVGKQKVQSPPFERNNI